MIFRSVETNLEAFSFFFKNMICVFQKIMNNILGKEILLGFFIFMGIMLKIKDYAKF